MKKILLNVSTLMLSFCALALGQTSHKMLWAKQMGGFSNDKGAFITTDPAGNIYLCGSFSASSDLDPGGGVFPATSHGGLDIFITKLDPGGNFMWSKTMGGTMDDYPTSLTVDASGYVITTGVFSGSMDFDPAGGAAILFASGPQDVFVSMLDAFGNYTWAKRMGGIEIETANGIAADKKLNVITVGSFSGTADFNPGAGVNYLATLGGKDIFVSKLNSFGNYVWARSVGSDSEDVAYAVETNNANGSFIVGSFRGSPDVDPGAGKYKLVSAGNGDGFLLHLDENGFFVKAGAFGGPGADVARGVALDAAGNIYITGSFSGTADFDPSNTASYNLTAQGNSDIFVLCLDVSGNFKWAKNIGASGYDCLGTSIRTDQYNNVFVAGSFSGTVDFDPGTSVYNLSSKGEGDVFVAKFSNTGNFNWAKQMGGSGADTAHGMEIDMTGNVLTTGSFQSSADFDPSWNTALLTSSGNNDIFIHGLIPCTPDTVNWTQQSCDSFILEGTKYTETGVFKQTVTGPGGCERFVTLDLKVSPHLNDTVTKSGVILTSKATGATYQWVECPSYKKLPGATASSYIAIGDGNYACIITNGICSDTTDCMEVKNVPKYNKVPEALQNAIVKIFPNPAQGDITIEADDVMVGADVMIYNVLGQKIHSFLLKEKRLQQTLDKGLYLIEITKGNFRATERIIVN